MAEFYVKENVTGLVTPVKGKRNFDASNQKHLEGKAFTLPPKRHH